MLQNQQWQLSLGCWNDQPREKYDLCSADNHGSRTPVCIAYNYLLLVVISETMPVLKCMRLCEVLWFCFGITQFWDVGKWKCLHFGWGEHSHREQHELASDWKLLLQCVCTHVVPVSSQCHRSICPVGKAEGTEIMTVDKGNFWEKF